MLMQKLVAILVNSLVGVAMLHAQTPARTELSSLVNASLKYAPKMDEALQAEKIAAEKMHLVELNKQPELNLDLSYAYVMPRIEWPINGQKIQFAPVNSLNGFVSTNYTLLDFGRQKSALDRARHELSTMQHAKEATAWGVAYQVASIYYQILYLRQAIQIQDTLLHVLQEAQRVASVQFQSGAALEIDVLSIGSSILTEENRKTELIAQLKKQEVLMRYATGQGVSNNAVMRWDNPLVTAGVDTINPALQLQQDKWAQTKLEVAAAQLRTRPLVALRGTMGSRNGYLPVVNDLRFNYVAGVGVSVPLYSGGKYRQQVIVQQQQAVQQELQLNTMKKDLERDMLVALEELSAAKEKDARAPAQVALAFKVLGVAQSKFKSGTGLYLEVITAGSGLQKAYWNQLQSQYQVCMASLELARLKGTRFWE